MKLFHKAPVKVEEPEIIREEKYCISPPNEDAERVSSLIHGPADTYNIILMYLKQRSAWFNGGKVGHEPRPTYLEKHPNLGLQCNRDHLSTAIPKPELWSGDVIEDLMLRTKGVLLATHSCGRRGFRDIQKIRAEVRNCVRAYARRALSDGLERRSKPPLTDEQWTHVLASLELAVPLLAEWCAWNYCRDFVDWSNALSKYANSEGQVVEDTGFKIAKEKLYSGNSSSGNTSKPTTKRLF